jgi:hypothetical protein
MIIMTKKKLLGYVGRFSLVHVITYVIIGMIFMKLQNYTSVFKTSAQFANYRPTNSPIVRATALIEILRGSFFALILYPFYNTIVKSKHGWLMLFGVLYGLTLIGSVAATPGSIEGFIYTKTTLSEHLIGIPEVTVQMLAFSWLFFIWERKVNRNRNKIDATDKVLQS